MLVVVANDLPPAVRGRMKLWFVEPRPNVFVSRSQRLGGNNGGGLPIHSTARQSPD